MFFVWFVVVLVLTAPRIAGGEVWRRRRRPYSEIWWISSDCCLTSWWYQLDVVDLGQSTANPLHGLLSSSSSMQNLSGSCCTKQTSLKLLSGECILSIVLSRGVHRGDLAAIYVVSGGEDKHNVSLSPAEYGGGRILQCVTSTTPTVSHFLGNSNEHLDRAKNKTVCRVHTRLARFHAALPKMPSLPYGNQLSAVEQGGYHFPLLSSLPSPSHTFILTHHLQHRVSLAAEKLPRCQLQQMIRAKAPNFASTA